MLLHRLRISLQTTKFQTWTSFTSPCPTYNFSRSDRTSRQSISPQFSTIQQQKTQNYFDQYRKQVQKDSVINQFRKQIFTSSSNNFSKLKGQAQNQQILGLDSNQLDKKLDREQRYIDKLLSSGEKEEISKYSKKILECFKSNKRLFKGDDVRKGVVFKDYADYTAYQKNYVSVEDRNYLDDDRIDYQNTQSRSYQFLQSLPSSTPQRQSAQLTKFAAYPLQSNQLTLSQFGKRLQRTHQTIQLSQQIQFERQQQKSYKTLLKQDDENIIDPNYNVYQSMSQTIDCNQENNFQMGNLSGEAMNKIYLLYVQGWSIREIARRFGILPARAKFHVWSRARFFNQALPKYGAEFLLATMENQSQANQEQYTMDYGLDLEALKNTQAYQSITSWQNKRVDSQRTADQYTHALKKLQKIKKYCRYDMVQVGTHGDQNKRHLLKEWKIYKGKGSDDFYLKNRNKVYRKFMFQKRRTDRSVYY